MANAFPKATAAGASARHHTPVTIAEKSIGLIHVRMCTVAMGNAEMVFANVIRVTLEHDVIFHLTFVLVLTATMERVTKAAVRAPKVTPGTTVIHQWQHP